MIRRAHFLLLLLLLAASAFAGDEKSYADQQGLSIWSGLVADAWAEVFRDHGVDPEATIVEVAPGLSPKVGVGLKMASPQFRGTVYVIEPTVASLQGIVARYRALFPQAKIVGIPKLLSEVHRSDIASPKIAYVVANHPMDDFVAGMALSMLPGDARHEFQGIFEAMYGARDDESEGEAARRLWRMLERRPNDLARIKKAVVRQWSGFLGEIAPEKIIISQYPSRTLQRRGIGLADLHAWGILDALRRKLPPTSAVAARHLLGRGQDPRHWLVSDRFLTEPKDEAAGTPGAVARLGRETFITQTAHYLDPSTMEVLAANQELAEHLYGARALDRRWLERWLLENYGLDLDPGETPTTGKRREVFVDRQRDGPERTKDISMAGNGGSGRAIYPDQRVNVKGPGPTKLVGKNAKPGHRNGRLASVIALWEYIAQNAASFLGAENGPVLAVIDLKRTAHFDNFGEVPISLLVRVDQGTMDRPSHVFQRPDGTIDLMETARRFGSGDAKRFMFRLIHGAWSSGNISLQGGLLDAETVSSVRGRAPVHTRARSFPSNWFGLEGDGQMAVLDDLVTATRGGDPAEKKKVALAFEGARRAEMNRLFLHLLGLDASETASVLDDEASRQLTHDLVSRFERLSRMMYPDYAALFPKTRDKSRLPVFDFSRLLRAFPTIYWGAPPGSPKAPSDRAFARLFNDAGSLTPVPPPKRLPEGIQRFVVKDSDQLDGLKREGRELIEKLRQLHQRIESRKVLKNPVTCANRAFVINEDLPYLEIRAVRDLLQSLLDRRKAGTISKEKFSETIELLRTANDRTPIANSDGELRSDLRLFEEGYRYLITQRSGARWLVVMLDHYPGDRELSLFIEGRPVATAQIRKGDRLRLVSAPLTDGEVETIVSHRHVKADDVVTFGASAENQIRLTDLLVGASQQPAPHHRASGNGCVPRLGFLLP